MAKSKSGAKRHENNDEPQEKYDYEAMTVKNLLAYAAEKDYDLQGATRKADIIAKIVEIEGK